ncbi:syntaxin-11-like [Salarias fasciatus]|uniref:Syntaxin-11-like n=1 Tax=Salarias fasciatus TaxID=181472 RepID=A0A672HU39_SALFA|nr:syntaxin-11-like [Salarias fasciatus]
MRDRLSHLHRVQIDTEGFSTVDLDNGTQGEAAGCEAAASSAEPHLDGVLQEAQQIRLQIQQIQNDISELKDVNYQALNKTSYAAAAAATKRDSNAIGTDIKRRAEAVLHRLHMLNDLKGELESERGSSDPAARIARTQYQCLSNALREVMVSYNDAEMGHREACKRQIQRHMEVVGRDVSRQDLERMMEEEEEITVFSVHSTGKTAHSALQQIKSRHEEIRDLEKRIQGIQELFLDVAVLVEEQGSVIENIQKNVQNTEGAVQEGIFKLERATASDKNNPFKKMFCGCFPCFYN